MSSTGLSFGSLTSSAARRAASPLAITRFDDWNAAEARWERLTTQADALPFQRAAWLRAWYGHCTGPTVEPLVLIAADPHTGVDVLALPLVRLHETGMRVIAFADRGLTDYNAPVLGTAYPDGLAPEALWTALRKALPPADRLHFEKMPDSIDGRPNPLAHLRGARPSKFIGNILHVPGSWEEWHRGLERTFRKELERSTRVFEKYPSAAFRRYTAGPEAERIYRELQALQRSRISELGLPYELDDEPARGFYESIVTAGLRDGTVVLTALTIGEEVVAALLGITDRRHYAMIRLATPGPRWKHFSPGRMVIERTMKMLHAEGFRAFDFTIGDYSYKRRIGVTPLPMREIDKALSLRGWPSVAAGSLGAWARRNAALCGLVARMRGAKSTLPPP